MARHTAGRLRRPRDPADHGDLELHLDDVRDLFVEPNLDPFSPLARYETGFATLINLISRRPLRSVARVVLVLPPHAITAGIEHKAKQALARYCRFRIHHNDNDLAAMRRQGSKALQRGAVILSLCLALSLLLDRATTLGFLAQLLSLGFQVAGWAAVWTPIDVFMNDWRPLRRDSELCQTIMRLDVVVRPRAAGATAGPSGDGG